MDHDNECPFIKTNVNMSPNTHTHTHIYNGHDLMVLDMHAHNSTWSQRSWPNSRSNLRSFSEDQDKNASQKKKDAPRLEVNVLVAWNEERDSSVRGQMLGVPTNEGRTSKAT